MNLFSSKTVLAALAAAVLSVATPAGAQTPNIRVDIPFSFIAGDQLLRAGEYRIDVDSARHVFLITSADNGSVSYVRALPVTTRRSSREADRPMVRFAKQGEQYVLEGVWQKGAIDGNTVVHSRRAVESANAAPVREIAAPSN
jgi:hypothetical protein